MVGSGAIITMPLCSFAGQFEFLNVNTKLAPGGKHFMHKLSRSQRNIAANDRTLEGRRQTAVIEKGNG